MLNREDIINIMRKLDVPIEGYWIESGASLVLHGVRDTTNDIDIGCSSSFIDYLISLGYHYIYNPYKLQNLRVIHIEDTIEIFEENSYAKSDIEIINGLPVWSLQRVRKQKEELGREKDNKDIILIDKFLDCRCKE